MCWFLAGKRPRDLYGGHTQHGEVGADPKQTLKELRPMQIPAGAQPERLNLVGWIEDANGPAATVGAIARSRCLP